MQTETCCKNPKYVESSNHKKIYCTHCGTVKNLEPDIHNHYHYHNDWTYRPYPYPYLQPYYQPTWTINPSPYCGGTFGNINSTVVNGLSSTVTSGTNATGISYTYPTNFQTSQQLNNNDDDGTGIGAVI